MENGKARKRIALMCEALKTSGNYDCPVAEIGAISRATMFELFRRGEILPPTAVPTTKNFASLLHHHGRTNSKNSVMRTVHARIGKYLLQGFRTNPHSKVVRA